MMTDDKQEVKIEEVSIDDATTNTSENIENSEIEKLQSLY
jgi:hypothetical protein